MANRRKFLAGLGALASGSAAAIGTGAFTSVEADRQVDVQVADDSNAYLGLTPANGANGAYAEDVGNDEVAVNFNDINDGNSSEGNVTTGGSGVNPNADTVAKSVFTIENQGTQEVSVSLTGSGDVSTQGQGTAISAPSSDGINASLDADDGDATLGTGKSIDVDFAINSGTSDLSGTLTISANETGGS
jgi:hypothetical protein